MEYRYVVMETERYTARRRPVFVADTREDAEEIASNVYAYSDEEMGEMVVRTLHIGEVRHEVL